MPNSHTLLPQMRKKHGVLNLHRVTRCGGRPTGYKKTTSGCVVVGTSTCMCEMCPEFGLIETPRVISASVISLPPARTMMLFFLCEEVAPRRGRRWGWGWGGGGVNCAHGRSSPPLLALPGAGPHQPAKLSERNLSFGRGGGEIWLSENSTNDAMKDGRLALSGEKDKMACLMLCNQTLPHSRERMQSKFVLLYIANANESLSVLHYSQNLLVYSSVSMLQHLNRQWSVSNHVLNPKIPPVMK